MKDGGRDDRDDGRKGYAALGWLALVVMAGVIGAFVLLEREKGPSDGLEPRLVPPIPVVVE